MSSMAQAAAARTRLLDLPDTVLERILVAASDGGRLSSLLNARRACSRLRAVSYAAARAATVHIKAAGGLAPLDMLPRLTGLARVQLELGYGVGRGFADCERDAPEMLFDMAFLIARGVRT